MKSLALWLCILCCGCTTPQYRYSAVPSNLIPPRSTLPSIKADEVACLTDEVYRRIVERERLRAQEIRELRALLEPLDKD